MGHRIIKRINALPALDSISSTPCIRTYQINYYRDLFIPYNLESISDRIMQIIQLQHTLHFSPKAIRVLNQRHYHRKTL